MVIDAQIISWREPETVEIPKELQGLFPENVFAELLLQRGIKTRTQALQFLYPDQYTPSNPFDIPGMQKGIDITINAIEKKFPIGIWGDFDADGQTSTSILFEGIRKFTPHVQYRIPIREKESHGLSTNAVEAYAEKGIKLLITCDTGISDLEAVSFANQLGITTIITDHHTLPDELPQAAAIINSQMLSELHPMRSLSGAGVAYKFIQALYHKLDLESEIDSLLDLTAIGLVADLVPLTGENRYLVQTGLCALQTTVRPGLLALYDAANISPVHLNEETISFAIAPRLNALGRVGDANPMIELLTTQDQARAKELIKNLEDANSQRKNTTTSVTQAAVRQIEDHPDLLNDPILILQSSTWPAGVIGVVASQLSELYNKPVVIITTPEGKNARGSARSIEGINIIEALAENQDYLIRFGGHPQAAGFAIENQLVHDFSIALQNTIQKKRQHQVQEETLQIDARVPLEIASSEQFIEHLQLLSPFGIENPRPNFLATGLHRVQTIAFGKTRDHRRLEVRTSSASKHSIIWWNSAHLKLPPETFDLVYQVGISSYQGNTKVQITYLDSRPTKETLDEKFPAFANASIIDRRGKDHSWREISDLMKSKNAILFSEGIDPGKSDIKTSSRFEMSPSEVLILATLPASSQILKQLLSIVQPNEIYVYSFQSKFDSKIKFMKYLTEILLNSIQKDRGKLDIKKIAAASGQREITIQKAIEFLANKTSLEIRSINDNEVLISNFGQPAEDNLDLLKNLDRLLDETKAFRQFINRTDLTTFFQNLEIEIYREKSFKLSGPEQEN